MVYDVLKSQELHHVIVFERSAGHTDSVEAVALSSVLPVAATASIDGKLLIWDNATLSVRGTCEHPEVRLCLKLVACCSAACMLFEHFVVEEGACHVHADFINCNRLLCDALSAQSVLVQFVLCRKSVDGDNASTINRLSAEHKLHKQQIVLIKHHKVGINHSDTSHEDRRLPRFSWCCCWSELVSKDHRLEQQYIPLSA